MTPEPSPHWNNILLSPDEAEEMVKAASFAIRLNKDKESGITYWGTGFFFWRSADGPIFALTADHNPRPSGGKRYFSAFYKGSWITLKWIEEWSSEKADIAVMRLCGKPDGLEIETLPVAFLDPSLPLHARRRFWGGRAILIYGYPIRGNGQGSWRVEGAIDAATPLMALREGGSVVPRLQIHGSRIADLEGISGAVIFDLHLRCVIGVEGSYDLHRELGDDGRLYYRGSGMVYGSEFAELIAERPALEGYFQSLLSAQEKPEKGIAVLARRESEPVPGIISVSVQFCPGGMTSGDVTSDHQAIRNQAQPALGGYFIGSENVEEKVMMMFQRGEQVYPAELLIPRDNPNPAKVAAALSGKRSGEQKTRQPGSPTLTIAGEPPKRLGDGSN